MLGVESHDAGWQLVGSLGCTILITASADALMGSHLALSSSGVMLPIAHVLAGTVWSIFHILIVGLQAFVFMMLTLVYIGQAHDAH